MSIINAIASVAVRGLNSAVKWYESLLRKAPSRPMPEVAEWGFERGGWLQVYQLPERAGSGSFTLAVSNLEEEVARLKKLNIDTSQRTSGEKVKTLMITDPDGNHIALVLCSWSGMRRAGSTGRRKRPQTLSRLDRRPTRLRSEFVP